MKISLFNWFAQTLGKAFNKTFSSNDPVGILKSLDVPKDLYKWVPEVADQEYELNAHNFPDLETRARKQKRKSGQFYTPIEFVDLLLETAQIDISGKILDPACGDGNFLLPVAQKLGKKSNGRFLEQIYAFDVDPQALLITLGRLIGLFPGCGWPVIEKRDFLSSKDRRRFDLVVGNPPYKVNLAKELKAKLISKFETAEGEKDLYTFFLEKSLKILRANGSMLMLTSHTFLVNHQCKKIRKFIFEDNSPTELFMLPERFFAHAPGVLPVVLVAGPGSATQGTEMSIHTSFVPGIGWGETYMADRASMALPTGLRNAILPEELRGVFHDMSLNNQTLGDICKIGVGIQESTHRGKTISRFVADEKIAENYKPVLKGRELKPFKINWEGKYINYGSHLTYPGKPEIFESEKILYQNIRNEKLKVRLVGALDRERFYPKNSLSYIVNPSAPFSLAYINGIFNSTLINAWFSGKFHSFHITVTQVKQIPIPVVNSESRAKVEKIHKQLSNLSDPKLFESLMNKLDLAVINCFIETKEPEKLLEACHKFLEQASNL